MLIGQLLYVRQYTRHEHIGYFILCGQERRRRSRKRRKESTYSNCPLFII